MSVSANAYGFVGNTSSQVVLSGPVALKNSMS
jgi:hypothetical protein